MSVNMFYAFISQNKLLTTLPYCLKMNNQHLVGLITYYETWESQRGF